ncbi:MAG TPA: hypothetical protein PLA45_02380 [Candidatus Dojkabacteria bacterium]|nr:hypothetical protein [Candidatus Dojkabacteria bacterium]
MEDWEKKLYKKFVQSRVTNPRELKGDTVWESEQWLTGSPRELVVFIQDILEQELDRAREEGKLYALDNLKDYIFINDTHRNKNLPLTWDDLRHYIKEAEQIYSEELSKLTTK